MHLLILDVDGTLVQSLEAEALLYPSACEQALGISGVSCDWESYRCPSDRGIVRELVEGRLGREASPGDYARVEERFLALIREAYARRPDLCRPVPGATEAVRRLRQLAEVALSIATAGWKLTATHKLAVAGFSVEDLPIATSHDAEEKVDIMKTSAALAARRCGVQRFDSVICFGDSAGDARAAAKLGYEFVGIDTSGFLASAEHHYADFAMLGEIIGTIRKLQRPDGAASAEATPAVGRGEPTSLC